MEVLAPEAPSVSGPDQHGAILVDGQLVDLDNFNLQIFEILVIQAKLALEARYDTRP